MAKTVQKHLTLDDVKTPLKDKLFTASLLALTMMGILVLFWYQNFGPGFKAFIRHYDTSDSANKTQSRNKTHWSNSLIYALDGCSIENGMGGIS